MINIDIREHKKLGANFSAFVSFDYDNRIVEVLRGLPFKNYDKDTTTWEIPVTKVFSVIESLQDFEIKLFGELSELMPKPATLELPTGFEFKTKPFSYQVDGLQFGLEHECWFLGDMQGLGKSKQAIDIAVARKLAHNYNHCLIVCGVNTLKWNWVNEIHTHSNEDACILGQKVVKGKIKIGSSKDKFNDLNNISMGIGDYPYFLITNVESFRDDDFATIVSTLCKRGLINMCVADEMHKMKNPSSQQSKGFLKCLPECRIGMTGTPLMNSPLDLYVILKWLGYETHPFYAFKKYYCVMGGYGGYEIIGYRNMEQLTAQINEIMLRRLKSDVLDLPEKLYVDEYVDMLPKQSKLYAEVESGIKSELAMGELDITNPLSALIRLRQTTGYTGILSEVVKESAKLDRMIEIVENCISNNEKVIIFSNWTQITDIVQEKLKSINCNCLAITGNTNDSDRQSYVEAFQNDPKYQAIVGTIGAMGTGLTLTAATTIIFMDEPWSRALLDQAIDRAHRIGQKNNISIHTIMCKDTIDERIHEIIYKKGVMSDAIIDGKVIGNKMEVFNYLLS
jgi:SNF2 family DNA or RNA helicase